MFNPTEIIDVMNKKGTAVCRLPGSDKWGLFHSPEQILTANTPSEITDIINQLEEQIKAGKHAAGFISYEAAPAFDEAHIVKECGDFPLCWFAVYENEPELLELPESEAT